MTTATHCDSLLVRLLPVVPAFRECLYSDPMEGTPEGLTDKLFWRKTRGEWHCFRKLAQVSGYVSLCQRREVSFVHGQQIARPEAHLRCSERWSGNGAAGMEGLRPGVAQADRELQ
jgi:hypothetical protein